MALAQQVAEGVRRRIVAVVLDHRALDTRLADGAIGGDGILPRIGNRLLGEDVHPPLARRFDAGAMHPWRCDDRAVVGVHPGESLPEVAESRLRSQSEEIGLGLQHLLVDVDEGDDLVAIGKVRIEIVQPAAGHAAGADHQATLLPGHLFGSRSADGGWCLPRAGQYMNATCGSKIRGNSASGHKKTADDLAIACSLLPLQSNSVDTLHVRRRGSTPLHVPGCQHAAGSQASLATADSRAACARGRICCS